MLRLRRAASLCLVLLAWCAPAQAQAPWPEVELPAHARSHGAGQRLGLNGLPMRLSGFTTDTGPQQTSAWFRRTLGQPLVENRLGAKQILGRAEGEYYITVQIEPASDGAGSRGTVAVTHLRGALQQRGQTHEAIDRWRRVLPAGTQITSHLRTQDNGKQSTHLVARNRHGEQLNAQRLAAALNEQGYELDRSSSPDSESDNTPAAAVTLLFRGQGKEATAVIARDTKGQTSIVLVTSVQMESMP